MSPPSSDPELIGGRGHHRNLTRGMVVAPQPEAAEAGVDALSDGGNAIDAAIACAMVQSVVDPFMCGIAGFGSLGIYTADDQELRYLDFHATAPLEARETMWTHLLKGEARDGFGFILTGNTNELGYQSICVPATLMALHEAHSRFGVLPWSRLVQPAFNWAENGWVVRPHVEHVWLERPKMGHASNRDRVSFSATGRAIFCGPDGTPKRVGDLVMNPDYAAVLHMIAEDGIRDFYEGGLARAMVDDVRANGGLLSLEDLVRFRPRWSEPIWSSYRGYRLGTNPPPGGGVMLAEMLNILEHFDLRAIGHNTPEYLRVVSEAMRQGTVDKDRFISDPDFVEIPVEELLSVGHARAAADRIRSGDRVHVPRLDIATESPDTTHLSVVDGIGNCVSMTHTLGLASGVISDGLGFMYNAGMNVFDPRPGNTHSIASGKARFSSMVPSVLFKGDQPYLVIGAPGGTQIAMGVLQVLLNVIDFADSMTEAVVRPRFSGTSDAIDVVNRIPRGVTNVLARQGYSIERSAESYGIALVHGIRIREDGTLDGGADPRGDGVALAIDEMTTSL